MVNFLYVCKTFCIENFRLESDWSWTVIQNLQNEKLFKQKPEKLQSLTGIDMSMYHM